MKPVLLSADGDRVVYSVPDVVAENLGQYCMNFCKWLQDSPDAAKYRSADGCLCFQEDAFIDYLNEWVFPDSPSVFVENLGSNWDDSMLPEQYKGCPWFNF